MFYEVKNKGNMIAAPINVYSTKVHRYKGVEGTILVGEHYER